MFNEKRPITVESSAKKGLLVGLQKANLATEKHGKHQKPARLDFSGAKGVVCLSSDYRIIDGDQAPASKKEGLPDVTVGECLWLAKKIHEFGVELNESSSNIAAATAALLHGDLDVVGNGSPNMASGDLYNDSNIFAGSQGNQIDTFQCKHVSHGTEDHHESEVREFESKPRMALFKEGEDDEPMAPHSISTKISNVVIGLKFGAIIFYEKYCKNMDKFTTVGLSSNIIFGGATFMKGENMKPRNYIYIGCC
jgi:hypothetical protein